MTRNSPTPFDAPIDDEPLAVASVPVASGWRRWLYLTLAVAFFVPGVLGFFLPVLPGTPFLLLTSYFLVRSSPTLNRRLLAARWVGGPLRDWQQTGGVRRRIKWQATVLIVGVGTYTVAFSAAPAVGKVACALLIMVGLTVVWRVPTLPDP